MYITTGHMLVYKLLKLANNIAMLLCNVYRYLHRYTYVRNYRATVCNVTYTKAGFLLGGKTTVCLYNIRRTFILQF